MARKLFLTLTAASLLVAGAVRASSVRTEELQLTDNAVEDRDPRASGPHTVFARRAGANGLDLYHMEGNAEPSLLAGGAGDQFDADIDLDPVIGDYRVVFVDDSLGRKNVAAVELSSGDRVDVTSFDTGTEVDNFDPSIEAGMAVWVQRDLRAGVLDMNREDVRGKNLNSGTEPSIASFVWNQSAPAIDGNRVAFEVNLGGGSEWDIEARIIGGGTFLIDSSAGDQRAPSVWQRRFAYISRGDVKLYDEGVSPPVATWITRDAFEPSNVRIEGDVIVWNDDRNGNLDIFLYDLLDGQEHQLTSDPSDQVLGDLDGNRIVFHDDRAGNLEIWQLTFEINHCPVAGAGADRGGAVGLAVELSGDATDIDLEAIVAWEWTLDGPAASTATIDDPSAQNTSFIPDLPGQYVVALRASDGTDWSAPATFVVDVPSVVPALEVLRCEVLGDAVEFLWRRPVRYDALEVYRDGALIDSPPVHVARFRDPSPGAGKHTYEVRGLVADEASQPRRCVAEVEELPFLTPGCACMVTLTPRRRRAWYRYEAVEGSTVVISLDGQDELDSNALYVNWGEPATEGAFDRAANERRRSSQRLVMDDAPSGTLYVLAQANFFSGEDSVVQLAVDVVGSADIALTAVAPAAAGAGGVVRVLVEGAGLGASTQFELDGQPVVVVEENPGSGTRVELELSLEGVPEGVHDLTARNPGGEVATVPFEVLPGVEKALEIELSGAQFARFRRRFGLEVRVKNPGTHSLPTPLLRVRPPPQTALRLADGAKYGAPGGELEFLGLPAEGPFDPFAPLGGGEVRLLFRSSPPDGECFPGEDCPLDFQALLFVPTALDEIDWDTLGPPEGVPAANWDEIRDALSREVGPLWAGYPPALARVARGLFEEEGIRRASTTELFRALVKQLVPDLPAANLPRAPLVLPAELLSPVSDWRVMVIAPLDPNEKTGEAGPDDLGISYRIEFENEGSAAAQNVVIEDTFFDPALLDLESFRFRQLQVGADSDTKSVSFDTDAYAVSGAFQAEYVAAGDPGGLDLADLLLVTYDLQLDLASGRFRVIINTEPPEPDGVLSVFSGALPVNDDEQRGAGHIEFSVRLRAPLQDDDSVENQGLISFDGLGCTDPGTGILQAVCPTSVVAITAADFDVPGELATHWVEERDGRLFGGWNPADRATDYAVFLWAEGAAEPRQPLVRERTAPFLSFPADLAAGAYRWRVVASNLFGERSGPRWSFDTSAPPAEGPGLVSPGDGATVPLGVVPLRWSGGTPGVTTHTVWLWRAGGRRPRRPIASALELPELDVAVATIGVRYSWQVILVDSQSGEAVPGPVWSFALAGSTFRRADSNADGIIDIADPLYTLFWLFLGDSAPSCEKSADASDDGEVDVPDVLFTLTYLFLDGPAPAPPFLGCGDEFTPHDSTSCESFAPCE